MVDLQEFTSRDCPMNELRRSSRLQESGYYRPDGTPVISYKERLYRVFKRRRTRRSQPSSDVPDEVTVYAPSPPESRRTPGSSFLKRHGFKIILFILFLLCGHTYVQRNSETHWTRSTHADRMPNFAIPLYASVVRSRSSGTYHPGGFFEMIRSWLCPKHMVVFQPGSPLVPGRCWPFAGDHGHLHIKLAQPVHITHVTLGHIVKYQSPTRQISSAPKQFSVYGMKALDGEKTFLGKFLYDENGPSFQTFSVQCPGQCRDAFMHVRLEVESNWGNTQYTCLYNFRVHGKHSHPVEADITLKL